MSTKSTKAKRIKKTAYSFTESNVCARVTISVDPKLLKIIDNFTNANNLSRSGIFAKALLLWCETLQEEADKDFYSKEADDPEVSAWSKITCKSIRLQQK